jgi:hypothetical protein
LTPTKNGYIWWISSEKGKSWTFHHHRPVSLELAESLHLFMSPSEVQDLLGQPNEAAEREGSGSHLWMYYAENGTALFLQFMRDELGVAKYERQDFGISGKPVQSIAQELGGRDIFKVMADRAWQSRSPSAYAKDHKEDQRTGGASAVVSVGPASTRPDPPKRRISGELANSVQVGMTRPEVVKIMGEPSGGMHISGGESDVEKMTYALDPQGEITFPDGKGQGRTGFAVRFQERLARLCYFAPDAIGNACILGRDRSAPCQFVVYRQSAGQPLAAFLLALQS